MTNPLRLAVAGVGLIGRRHAALVQVAAPQVRLSAVVDPSPEGRRYAQSVDVPWYDSLATLFAADRPDGVIVATPTQMHVENGLACVAAGCPVLIEKPVATSAREARVLIDSARASKVPVLVGHHRRHNPLVAQAKQLISSGILGRITAIHSVCWMKKPDDYFAPAWRRESGAGPLMTNAIHDLDLLRHLCGEIIAVQAVSSNAARSFAVEDTTVTLLHFESGALGTLSVSDAVASPWSWETTSGETPDFTSTQQSCYYIGGSQASLSLPEMRIWKHEGEGHWKSPISATAFPRTNCNPHAAQIEHFAAVIRGTAIPLVSGEEGMKSLRLVEAIQESATTRSVIEPMSL